MSKWGWNTGRQKDVEKMRQRHRNRDKKKNTEIKKMRRKKQRISEIKTDRATTRQRDRPNSRVIERQTGT